MEILSKEREREEEPKIKIKYEINNLTKMVEKLDIFVKEYNFISKIRESMKKCVCVIEDNEKNKYILKAKLKNYVSECEMEIYKKIQKNPHENIIKIRRMFLSKNFFVVIYDYINGYDMASTEYYYLYKNNIKHIYHDCLLTLSHLHILDIYHYDIKPDNIIVKYNKDKDIYIPIIIDFDLSYNGNMIKSDNNKYERLININKDITKLTLSFYYYFFYKNVERINDIKFDAELTECYDGEYKEFVELLCWILKHDIDSCPSINEIINKMW